MMRTVMRTIGGFEGIASCSWFLARFKIIVWHFQRDTWVVMMCAPGLQLLLTEA